MNNKKVLVVEDDVALRNLVVSKLNYEGFKCLVANNGEEGLKLALKDTPNIIILDILMPKMNGIEMLKKLREDKRGTNVPVVLLTNDTDPDHLKEAYKNNASPYITKSDWNLNDMVALINKKISH